MTRRRIVSTMPRSWVAITTVVPGAVDAVEQLHDAERRVGVEVPGRLVGQQDQRPVHEGTSDRHPLLLAAGQLVRVALELLGQADELEDGRHLGPDDVLGPADHLEGEGDVLVHRLVREQLEVLEDAADVAAQVRHLPARQLGDVLAGDPDPALLGHLLLVHQPEHRGLARPRGADEEDELALLDVDLGVTKGDDLALVDLRDVLELDHGGSSLAADLSRSGDPWPAPLRPARVAGPTYRR